MALGTETSVPLARVDFAGLGTGATDSVYSKAPCSKEQPRSRWQRDGVVLLTFILIFYRINQVALSQLHQAAGAGAVAGLAFNLGMLLCREACGVF